MESSKGGSRLPVDNSSDRSEVGGRRCDPPSPSYGLTGEILRSQRRPPLFLGRAGLKGESLASFGEGFFEKVEIDGFGENGDGAGILGMFGRGPGGDEDDAGGGIFGNNIATGGGAIQFRHPIVHQDDVGLVAIVGLDGFEAGTNHFDDFVLAMRNQRGQRCSHTSLVVGDEYAHAEFAELFMPKTEARLG
jgi:hypothetical protein